jgi:RHS repeat-associated protein
VVRPEGGPERQRSPQQPDPEAGRHSVVSVFLREISPGEGARPEEPDAAAAELWVEHGPEGLEAVPYRFTGKELDEEAGLYYYGARYFNPRTSRWISADPAIDKYLPEVPKDNEARRRNRNLPGEGGIFNPVNLAVYHYAMNNPLSYRDPTGVAGQKETVPSDFRPLQYLRLFEEAPYRDPGAKITKPDSSTKPYSATVKVGTIEFLGRLGPIGEAGTSPKEMPESRAEALKQFVANTMDPDTKVSVTGWIVTDPSKEHIVDWSISVSGLRNLSSEDSGRPGKGNWALYKVPDERTALRVLLENPELMYKLLKKAGMLEE